MEGSSEHKRIECHMAAMARMTLQPPLLPLYVCMCACVYARTPSKIRRAMHTCGPQLPVRHAASPTRCRHSEAGWGAYAADM